MDRRRFLAQASLLSSAAFVPIKKLTIESNPKYKLGYQLYSIRDEMAKDPIATLEALKGMGYQDFEAYGYDTESDTFYGHKSKEFKKILDDRGLTMTSGHYQFAPLLKKSDDEMKRFVDQCIIGADNVNSKYITWPWIAPEQRKLENYKLMAGKLNIIGEQVTQAGLKFAYHNHGFEFEDHDGENGFDIITRGTDPELVKIELDMYWVKHSAKRSPKDLVREMPGRIVMWHIKDMDKVSRDYTELGNGSIDYVEELPDPDESGLEFYYIEQGGNYATSSMQSASDSAEYFKKDLQHLLR